MSKGGSVLKAAGVVASVTVISKVLGLVRDQMIAHAYGASLVSDAYLYAFQIPSFALVLLGGLGGPFHTATVSVLSKLIPEHAAPTETAQKLVNTFLTWTGLISALAAIVVFVWAAPIIDLIAHQAPPELKALAAQQMQWMAPMIFVGGIIGIFYGVANVTHRFFWPSISPSAINVTLIAWLAWLGPDAAGFSLAISTMLGGVLQLAVQLPDFFQAGFRLKPALDWRAPAIAGDLKTMGELLFPATIGTTIGQLNIYVAMFFVSQLEPGGWTATMLGNRLIQLPIGVLTIAMLVPLFPKFSRWVGLNELEPMRASFRDGILSLWLLSMPMMVLIALISQSGIALLFQRGAFDAHDTQMVAIVLMVLALSVWPYMLRDALTRVFYAFNDSKTPLIAGLTSIVINFLANALLVGPFGIGGIAFATVIVTVCNAVILSILVRRHVGSMGLSQLVRPAVQFVAAGAVAFASGWAVLHWGFAAETSSFWSHLAAVLSVTLVVSLVYGAMVLGLKVELAWRLYHRVTARFR